MEACIRCAVGVYNDKKNEAAIQKHVHTEKDHRRVCHMLCIFMILVLGVSNLILYQSNITKIQRTLQDECGIIGLQISNIYDDMAICQNSTIQGINQTYEEPEAENRPMYLENTGRAVREICGA